MRRGRAPCCDKAGLKKGPWTPAEDMRLMAYIHKYGHGNWRALPKQAGLLRCGKSCRLRWINYLRPDLKRGNFTQEEEETIIKLHGLLGNKWSKIAARLPGRTDNEIKNVWNTHLKKRAPSKGPKESLSSSSSKSSPWDACGNQCESAGQDEQVHPTVGSEGDRETGDAECLEKKQKPLEETIEITIEPSIDIWEIIEDSSAMSLDPIYGKDENTWDIQLKEEKFGSKDGGSKESSSSSISNGSWPMQVEVIEPEGKAHPQLKSERRSDCHDMGHKEMQHDPFGLLPEIPIDPNLHIWNILDDGQSLKVPPLIVPTDMDGAHHSIKDTANEESRGEGGNERWISYLEKELELWGPAYEHHRSLPTIEPFYPCPYYDPKLATDEVDPIIAYFQMQPPSPPIFSL